MICASENSKYLMKMFISSLISGMEAERKSAKKIIKRLGHEAVTAEDFSAQPNSPQISCLQGLRQSGLVVLILNELYGETQASGISATHEEYREAKETRPVIAFIKQAANREASQQEFIAEVSNWSQGVFRESYNSVEDLEDKLTKALHSWEVNQASAPVDDEALSKYAIVALQNARNGFSRSYSSNTPDLLVSIISGPSQAILRPSQMEDEALAEKLLPAALFGPHKIFDKSSGCENYIEGENLYIRQNDGGNFIVLDPKGGLTFGITLQRNTDLGHWGGMVIVKEQLLEKLKNVLLFGAFVLDTIDNTNRLTHFSLAVAFGDGKMFTIQTQAEAQRNSNSINLGSFLNQKRVPVQLTPAVRHRSALVHDIQGICEDLFTLLKRSLA
jgi:hypothetical protein